jgi:hypothetical protein
MNGRTITDYLLNCMLLLLPVLAWNGIFTSRLPQLYSREIFWRDIPSFIAGGENILRLVDGLHKKRSVVIL